MKITVINGSNRKKGNTQNTLELLTETLTNHVSLMNQGIKFEFINLGEYKIETCKGCRICFDQGEEHCPLKDDVQSILDKIKSADLVVFASPVYVSDVSGLMKNWIDRMAYICHRPSFAGKPAYVIATTGGSPAGQTIKAIQGALLTWGFHLCGSASFVTGARMEKNEIKQRYSPKIHKIADKIIRELSRAQKKKPSLIELVIFRIQQNTWKNVQKDTLDYQYWQKNGWLEPACAYYCPNQTNIFSILLSRLIGSVISIFF